MPYSRPSLNHCFRFCTVVEYHKALKENIPKANSESSRTSMMEPLTIFYKKLHPRYPTGFLIPGWYMAAIDSIRDQHRESWNR